MNNADEPHLGLPLFLRACTRLFLHSLSLSLAKRLIAFDFIGLRA